jgi:hypothetical protein
VAVFLQCLRIICHQRWPLHRAMRIVPMIILITGIGDTVTHIFICTHLQYIHTKHLCNNFPTISPGQLSFLSLTYLPKFLTYEGTRLDNCAKNCFITLTNGLDYSCLRCSSVSGSVIWWSRAGPLSEESSLKWQTNV